MKKYNFKISAIVAIIIMTVLFYFPIWGSPVYVRTSFLLINLLAFLFSSAIFIMPIVMWDGKFVKILSVLSIFISSSVMLLMYHGIPKRTPNPSSGWEILMFLLVNILWVLAVLITTLLAFVLMALYKKIKCRKESIFELLRLIMFKFVLPFFYVILIILSLAVMLM